MNAAGASGVAILPMVLCRLGDSWYGIEGARVAGLDAAAAPSAPSLGALLGLGPDAGTAPGRRLRLRTAGGEFALAVREPVIWAEVPATALRPLPPILAAVLRLPWVRALALCPDLGAAPVVVLDFDRPGVDPRAGGGPGGAGLQAGAR